jgi:hypothetical protein
MQLTVLFFMQLTVLFFNCSTIKIWPVGLFVYAFELARC